MIISNADTNTTSYMYPFRCLWSILSFWRDVNLSWGHFHSKRNILMLCMPILCNIGSILRCEI